jgi:hypothetical protein
MAQAFTTVAPLLHHNVVIAAQAVQAVTCHRPENRLLSGKPSLQPFLSNDHYLALKDLHLGDLEANLSFFEGRVNRL